MKTRISDESIGKEFYQYLTTACSNSYERCVAIDLIMNAPNGFDTINLMIIYVKDTLGYREYEKLVDARKSIRWNSGVFQDVQSVIALETLIKSTKEALQKAHPMMFQLIEELDNAEKAYLQSRNLTPESKNKIDKLAQIVDSTRHRYDSVTRKPGM